MWGNALQICNWTRKYLRNILSCVMSGIQQDMNTVASESYSTAVVLCQGVGEFTD